MSAFAFLILCIQACLIHNAYSACVGSLGYANSLGGLGSIGYSTPCGAGLGAGLGALTGGFGNAAAYGGIGEGQIVATGEMPVQGMTVVGGQVPVLGAVQFGGDVSAAGSVYISGRCGCGCGCGGGAGYYL